jgi:hypothetical protein
MRENKKLCWESLVLSSITLQRAGACIIMWPQCGKQKHWPFVTCQESHKNNNRTFQHIDFYCEAAAQKWILPIMFVFRISLIICICCDMG